MWKDFFYYSKSERIAVYVLSLLIVVFMIGSIVLPYYLEEPIENMVEIEERVQFTDSIREKERLRTSRKFIPEKRHVVLKEFDPNTADSIDFLNLGLPPFMASNILKYRAKGGSFSTPESFSRIYGMTEERFAQLRPYIKIADRHLHQSVQPHDTLIEQPVDSFPKIFKYSEGTLVDVGIADTTELKKIPGIGSGIAGMIVAYRNRLGGFYSLDQLKEVEYVTPEMMKWFALPSVSIQKIPINKAGLDRLRMHPYINFYQAKVIVEYRKKRGKIESLSQLSLYEEFTEKDLDRLVHYFSFD